MKSSTQKDCFYLEKLAAARPITPGESQAKIQWNWRRVYKRLQRKRGIKLPKSKTPKRVHGKGYSEWRELVLVNTDFRCAICDTLVNVQAHHIESYHANPQLRLDPDNGVALCKRCHDDFHFTFGWRNNTEEQWRTYYSLKK